MKSLKQTINEEIKSDDIWLVRGTGCTHIIFPNRTKFIKQMLKETKRITYIDRNNIKHNLSDEIQEHLDGVCIDITITDIHSGWFHAVYIKSLDHNFNLNDIPDMIRWRNLQEFNWHDVEEFSDFFKKRLD